MKSIFYPLAYFIAFLHLVVYFFQERKHNVLFMKMLLK